MSNGNNGLFEEINLYKPPPLKIHHKRIPIDKVNFDPENPRLKYAKQLDPTKTDHELLFAHSDTAWLKKDIGEKGVLDAIYVRAESGGTYLVVEGNRRTAVVKELHNEKPDDALFTVIPARVLPEAVTQEQEALLMASFHVAGKVKWDAHEKAGHIHHMLKVLHIPEAEMTNTLHMAIPTIKRTAQSFELLEHFKQVDDGKYAKDANRKWSFFAQLLAIKDLRKRNEENPNFKDEFCRWVGDERIPRAEDVRDLPEILKKKRAKDLFENEPVEDAFRKAKLEIDRTNPARNSKFYKVLEQVAAIGPDATLTDIDSANTQEGRDILNEAYQVIGSFMERAGVPKPVPRRVA